VRAYVSLYDYVCVCTTVVGYGSTVIVVGRSPLGLDSHERQLAGKTARRTLGHNQGYEERDK
jgi:hypothetical protein